MMFESSHLDNLENMS